MLLKDVDVKKKQVHKCLVLLFAELKSILHGEKKTNVLIKSKVHQ